MLLPKKVTFYCKSESKDGVLHAFPIDSEAINHDTAENWATENKFDYNYETYSRENERTIPPTVFELENKGFDNVTITDLKQRGNGGRAYQVVLDLGEHKVRIDLREKALMDVINNAGILAGGKLNGTFCFIKDGAQTNLVREGSKDHQEAVKDTNKKKTFTKNIKKSDLKVGYEYETLSGNKSLFLGFVYTADADIHTGELSKPYKAMLFVRSGHNFESLSEDLRSDDKDALAKKVESLYLWDFKIAKTHSLKIENGRHIDIETSKVLEKINAFGEAKRQRYLKTTYFGDALEGHRLGCLVADKKDINIDNEGLSEVVKAQRDYEDRRRHYWRGW